VKAQLYEITRPDALVMAGAITEIRDAGPILSPTTGVLVESEIADSDQRPGCNAIVRMGESAISHRLSAVIKWRDSVQKTDTV
jgi:hypothetical protein